jgi:hypothetical protein
MNVIFKNIIMTKLIFILCFSFSSTFIFSQSFSYNFKIIEYPSNIVVCNGFNSNTIGCLDTLNVCAGDSTILKMQFTSSPVGVCGNYQWQKNGVNLPSATSDQYTVLDSGVYRLLVFCSSVGAMTTIGNIVVKCVTTNLNEKSISNFKIYPNPLTDRIIIQQTNFENITVEIYNSIGQLFLTKKVDTAKEEIDLSFLENGAYYISLNNGKGVARQKIIKNAH